MPVVKVDPDTLPRTRGQKAEMLKLSDEYAEVVAHIQRGLGPHEAYVVTLSEDTKAALRGFKDLEGGLIDVVQNYIKEKGFKNIVFGKRGGQIVLKDKYS